MSFCNKRHKCSYIEHQHKMKYNKFLFTTFVVLFTSFIFLSCSKNEDDEREYFADVTTYEHYDMNANESFSIRKTYADAFQRHGLVFNGTSFSKGTSTKKIIDACKEADKSIQTSATKFVGYFVYEVYYMEGSDKKTVYCTSYGLK